MLFLAICLLGSSGGVDIPTSDSNISISYEIQGNNIDFTLTCTYGWCALGFGNGMRGADMFIALYPSGGSLTLMDTYSSTPVPPPLDTTLGGSDNLTLQSSSAEASTFTVTFRRSLSASESQDKAIVLDTAQDFSYAYRTNTNTFNVHEKFSRGTVVISAGSASVTTEDNEDDRETHGRVMTIAWYIMIPIAIIFERYFKWFSLSGLIHLLLGLVAVIMTVGSVNFMYNEEKNVYGAIADDDERKHSRLGLTIGALVIGQAFMGFMAGFYMYSGKILSRLALIRRLHKVMGWFLLGFSMYNVFLGNEVHEHEDNIVVPIIIIVIFALLEFRHQFTYLVPSLNCRLCKIKEMTHEETYELIQDKKKKLVFCDQYVLDVNPFMYSHPGSALFFKKAIGEDVGKYLVGCSSYGANFLPYTHSRPAMDMVEHLAIGKLPAPASFFMEKSDYIMKDKVRIIRKTKVAEWTYLLELDSTEAKINDKCANPTAMGKHFKVNLEGKSVGRYYSAFFCDYQNWNIDLMPNLENDYVKKTEGSIQLMIKMYPDGLMTGNIHQMNTGDHLLLSGPFGPGLALTAFEGNFFGVFAGTGLIPVLDLVYYMWENRNTQNMKLTMYISFSSRKFAIAEDIINQAVADLGDSLNVVWYFSDEANGNPKEIIQGLKDKSYDKVWICGPSGFNRFAYNILRTEPKIPRSNIIMM